MPDFIPTLERTVRIAMVDYRQRPLSCNSGDGHQFIEIRGVEIHGVMYYITHVYLLFLLVMHYHLRYACRFSDNACVACRETMTQLII